MKPFLQWKSGNLRILSACVLASVIEHAMRMHHIVVLCCPNLKYFSTLSHKRHNFRKNAIEHELCVLIFLTSFA